MKPEPKVTSNFVPVLKGPSVIWRIGTSDQSACFCGSIEVREDVRRRAVDRDL